jgi:hypothetical protein
MTIERCSLGLLWRWAVIKKNWPGVIVGLLVLIFSLSSVDAQQTSTQPAAPSSTIGADQQNAAPTDVTTNLFTTNLPQPPVPPTLPDEIPRGQTVAERPHPDYEPVGAPIASFTLYPNLTLGESWNSNILGTKTSPLSDFISSIQPSMDLKSNWDTNALNFHFDDSFQKYAEHSDQDYNDYTFSSNGRLDVQQDLQLFGGIGYSVRHEPVYSPNNPGVISPLFTTIVPEQYSDLAANAAVQKTFNRLTVRLDANYDKFNFANVASATGVPVQMSLENYDQELLTVKTSYEIAPLRSVYLLATYDWRNYEFPVDLTGVNRTSQGYTAAAGISYDLTGITFLDLYAGYLQQNYIAPLPSVSGPTGGVKLTWNVTRLTTVTANLAHGVAETLLPGASSYLDTTTTLTVDHELLRNLILDGYIGYEQQAFQGVSRTDDYYSAGVSAKYLINRHFWVSLGYTYLTRNSSGVVSDTNQSVYDFNQNIILLSFSAHL